MEDHGNDNNNDQMNLGEDDSGIEILAEAANLNEGNVNEEAMRVNVNEVFIGLKAAQNGGNGGGGNQEAM